MSQVDENQLTTAQAAAGRFIMPKPELGQTVTYRALGRADDPRPTVGTVCSVRHGTVALALPGGAYRDGVKHVDDPRLTMNPEQREAGCWEFTERDRRIDGLLASGARLAAIEAELSRLGGSVEAIETNEALWRQNPGQGAKMKELWALRHKCNDLGVENYKTLNKEECEKFLASTPQPAPPQ